MESHLLEGNSDEVYLKTNEKFDLLVDFLVDDEAKKGKGSEKRQMMDKWTNWSNCAKLELGWNNFRMPY